MDSLFIYYLLMINVSVVIDKLCPLAIVLEKIPPLENDPPNFYEYWS